MEKIILRSINLNDVDDLYEYGQDENVTRFVTWGPYKTKFQALNSIKALFLNQQYHYAIVDNEIHKMIGTISLVKYDQDWAYLGYCLNAKYWNLGIATLVIEKFLNLLKQNSQFQVIYAEVISENYGSIRVLEKNDFIFIKDIKLEQKNQTWPAKLFCKIL